MTTIPIQYEETIRDTLRTQFHKLTWQLQESYGIYEVPILPDLMHTPLADMLASIARAAAGQRQHDDDDEILAEEIHDVLAALVITPQVSHIHIKSDFWQTPLGTMLSRAQIWLQDDLISISEAAQIAGISVPGMTQAANDNRIQVFINPDAPERQGRRLVSRYEVEKLWSKH